MRMRRNAKESNEVASFSESQTFMFSHAMHVISLIDILKSISSSELQRFLFSEVTRGHQASQT